MSENSIEINLDRILKSLWSSRKLLAKSSLLNFAIVLILYFIITPSYLSSFVLMPSANEGMTSYERAASLFGMVGSSDIKDEKLNSPDIVEEIIKSRSFSDELINQFVFDQNGQKIKIQDLIIPSSDDKNIYEVFNTKLRKVIKISQDIETGIYNINVISSNPVLSQNLCNQVLETFLKVRKKILLSTTEEKKTYMDNQIGFLFSQMNQIENELVNFLEQNRDLSDSPALELKFERMKNELDITSELYWGLKRDYEIIISEEIGLVPGIMIIDYPALSNKKYFPKPSYFLTIFLISFLTINIPYVIYKNSLFKSV